MIAVERSEERTSAGRRVEVETAPEAAETFTCCLFLPQPQAEDDRGQRKVKRPQLLCEPGVELKAEHEVEVLAAELTGPGWVRWKVEGDPQPFGPPGEELVGKLAMLKRVRA